MCVGMAGKGSQAVVLARAGDDRVDRLERALVVAAYIVVRYGAVYAPYVDRLEAELEAARKGDAAARARRILARYAAGVEDRGEVLELSAS